MKAYDTRIRNKIIELASKGLSCRTITDEIEITERRVSSSYVHKVLKEEDLNIKHKRKYKLTIRGEERKYFNDPKEAFTEGIKIIDDPGKSARTMEIKKL